MRLELILVNSKAFKGIQEGPLRDQIDGFCRWLGKQGYSNFAIRDHIAHISYFNTYIKQCNINSFKDITADHVEDFISGYLPQPKKNHISTSYQKAIAGSVHRFVEYLHECGLIDEFRKPVNNYQPLIDGYLKWLKNYKNSSPKTLIIHQQYLVQFLEWLNTNININELYLLTPEKVQEYFINYAKNHGQSCRRSMQSTLRMFFRYCVNQGYIKKDLSLSIPTLRTYKLSRIPYGIEDKEARRLLASIDRNTDSGRRDYAIIQILYTYGVRGGQVSSLRFDNINWEASQIHFKALKHGKKSLVPLTDNVGESLLDYLQNSRPDFSYPEIFLTVQAPYRPLASSDAISTIVARRMHMANIKSPNYGARAFRHLFASRMLKNGYSLKYIADMIGHRNISTTFIYTKIDFDTLKVAALNWPEDEL